MIGSKEMAELEQKKCSSIPLLLKAVKITVVTLWRCWFLSLKTTGSQFVCLVSFYVWELPLWWWDEPSPLLCGQPEDFEGVEGGGKSDLMIRMFMLIVMKVMIMLSKCWWWWRWWWRWGWWQGWPPPGSCSGRPLSSPPSQEESTARSAGKEEI